MNEVCTLIKDLTFKGVIFENGLTKEEIAKVEGIYKIKFPHQFRELLEYGVPTSHNFYNWKDLSKKNIEYIKYKIRKPLDDILENVDDIDHWPIIWGDRPNNEFDLKRKIRKIIQQSPKLISVFRN